MQTLYQRWFTTLSLVTRVPYRCMLWRISFTVQEPVPTDPLSAATSVAIRSISSSDSKMLEIRGGGGRGGGGRGRLTTRAGDALACAGSAALCSSLVRIAAKI